MQPVWLKEALFAGQTAVGHKLATSLGLGWFWSRINGCRIVYRGRSIEGIDEVVAIAEADASEITLPSYLSHEPGEIWFYVVRCANRCGRVERTLHAAVKVAIDGEGKLDGGKPNDVFGLAAGQKRDGNIEVVWHYCPIEQESPPAELRVYFNDGTREVDYQNLVATLEYRGRRFYRYKSEQPGQGRYAFSVRAADAKGNEHKSMKTIAVEVVERQPEMIEIVDVESR